MLGKAREYTFFDRHGVSVRALKQQPVCTIILDISVVLLYNINAHHQVYHKCTYKKGRRKSFLPSIHR